MSPQRFSCLVLALAVAALCVDAAGRSSKVQHLRFTNGLTNKVLNVNCKNMVPYTDLGLNILLPKEEYQFQYEVNRTTLYSCNLRHGDTNTIFPISDPATKRECGSNKCVFKSTEAGVSLLNGKTNQYNLKYLWGKKYSDMHFG